MASFAWVHHWNPLTVSIVAIWLISTIACFVFARRALRWGEKSAAMWGALGMTVAVFSLLLLLTVGIASAAGFGGDVPMCGGG